MKLNLSNFFHIGICGIGIIFTLWTMADLMYFLSYPFRNKQTYIFKNDFWISVSWSLLVNTSLVILFIIQHSVMSSEQIKSFFNTYNLNPIYRSIYIICTSLVLQILIKNWLYTPELILWELNFNLNSVHWLYFGIHIISWVLIYVGNICMDVNELLGVKQVLYYLKKLPNPSNLKSPQLNRLYVRLRHPSFLAFFLIFWCTSVMSLDRFLLATILSLYMYIAWNTEFEDYSYQKDQYELKFHELQYLNN